MSLATDKNKIPLSKIWSEGDKFCEGGVPPATVKSDLDSRKRRKMFDNEKQGRKCKKDYVFYFQNGDVAIELGNIVQFGSILQLYFVKFVKGSLDGPEELPPVEITLDELLQHEYVSWDDLFYSEIRRNQLCAGE